MDDENVEELEELEVVMVVIEVVKHQYQVLFIIHYELIMVISILYVCMVNI